MSNIEISDEEYQRRERILNEKIKVQNALDDVSTAEKMRFLQQKLEELKCLVLTRKVLFEKTKYLPQDTLSPNFQIYKAKSSFTEFYRNLYL